MNIEDIFEIIGDKVSPAADKIIEFLYKHLWKIILIGVLVVAWLIKQMW